MLYEDIPDTLSQLIRTAFVPKEGTRFIVADFSAIEARVIAWFAGEKWRAEVFASGGDIYCASASQMFKVPVKKHGVNGHLRQKGKIAELACIAEGSLVLTNKGLIPIESITQNHKLWDGFEWCSHEGVIFKGERQVVEYEGLRATKDHLVWVEGQSRPVRFEEAATSGSHLIQSGDGRKAIRIDENSQFREEMEQNDEPLLYSCEMYKMWADSLDRQRKPYQWKKQRMSALLTAKTNTKMVRPKINRCKTEMCKSKSSRISKLWRKRNRVLFPFCFNSRIMDIGKYKKCKKRFRVRQNRYQRALRKRQYQICYKKNKSSKQKDICNSIFQRGGMALCKKCCNTQIVSRINKGRYNQRCYGCSVLQEKELENDRSKIRVYDIRNAGPKHRFTVSGKLVHNCGYGGSVGALKSMGALEMGLQENELQSLIKDWRKSNPNIVRFWWDVDNAIKRCIKERKPKESHGIKFFCQSGMLFIVLPSGRKLAYVKPRIGENRFGGESVTYEGVGGTKKWERLESYGPKFVENIVQAASRDILVYAMQTLRRCSIVAHVHDEIIIEADSSLSLDFVCKQMGRVPDWAKGLILRADGYTCDFYQKD